MICPTLSYIISLILSLSLSVLLTHNVPLVSDYNMVILMLCLLSYSKDRVSTLYFCFTEKTVKV